METSVLIIWGVTIYLIQMAVCCMINLANNTRSPRNVGDFLKLTFIFWLIFNLKKVNGTHLLNKDYYNDKPKPIKKKNSYKPPPSQNSSKSILIRSKVEVDEKKFNEVKSLVSNLCMRHGLNIAHDYDGVENIDDIILYLKALSTKQ